jgi:hypothetical protein
MTGMTTQPTQPSVEARARAIPVLWWAACGAVFLVTSVVVYAKPWSKHPKSTTRR